MGTFPLERIAIVGGGLSGWLAAATLARVLRGSSTIHVLELSGDAAINGAVASVPSLHRLLHLLAIDESGLMRATQATYRLGTQFCDWGGMGDRYFQGFGSIGAKLDAVPFQHHWLRLTHAGDCAAFEDFSVAAQVAFAGRFAVPQSDPRSVLSLFSYAWHFDARLLAGVLREHALKAGVTRAAGEVAAAEFASGNGHVRTVVLTDGTRVDADLFIDCSGAHGVLSTALDLPFDDWSAWLPCDRQQTLHCTANGTLPPYSEAVADTAGWLGTTPLQHETVRTFVYSSKFIGDDAATERLTASAGNGARGSPRRQRLLRGRPKEFWTRNCLLLPGDGLDPLESVNLHLSLTGITRFLAHFPVRTVSPPDLVEYNRITAEEYDRVRDLLAIHYRATTRNDSPFRDRCRSEPAPEDLARKLALFTDSGRVNIDEDDHCGVDGWLAVLLGQGLRPKSWDPLAETTPLATARGALAKMAAEIRARATALPMHREYIAMRGATAPQLAGQNHG